MFAPQRTDLVLRHDAKIGNDGRNGDGNFAQPIRLHFIDLGKRKQLGGAACTAAIFVMLGLAVGDEI